jgi:hypothetical protein
MHFRHLSSSGKLKLLNGDKVEAPQSLNEAKLFGQHFFRKSTLSGSLGYDRKAFRYYGYSGDRLPDPFKDLLIPRFQDRQYFSKGTANVMLKSETLSANDMNYNIGINYHYLVSKTGQKESQTVFSGNLGKKFGNTFGILNTSITYYNADSIIKGAPLKHQMLLRLNPSVKWVADNASFQAGLHTTMVFGDNADIYFYPVVKAEWSPVVRILTLFAGVDGHLQHNTWSAIATENPYVDPYHDVANANNRFIFSGGFKGKLSSKTNYVAEASYSVVNDQHFYYSKTNEIFLPGTYAKGNEIYNTFNLIYDDVKILKFSGEVLHSVSDNFSLHLLGNYYSYDLNSIQEAWQMPDFDLTFSGIYKATEKLKFSTDIYLIGSRTALVSEPEFSSLPSKQVKMEPIIDLNAGAEYQFSDKLNFFVKLNNFGFQKYEQWLGYTSKGFNWMAGASYSF